MRKEPLRSRVLVAALAIPCLLPRSVAAQDAPLLAEACNVCHGRAGTGMDSIPPLAGRDASDLAAAMAAFRTNERPATIMGRIARGYTAAEIAALVSHYAGQR